MNERIQELAEQACFDEIGKDYSLYFNLTKDKVEMFAKLIVKKFDDILVLEYLDCVGNQDRQSAERIDRLRERVKTYFGVEE